MNSLAKFVVKLVQLRKPNTNLHPVSLSLALFSSGSRFQRSAFLHRNTCSGNSVQVNQCCTVSTSVKMQETAQNQPNTMDEAVGNGNKSSSNTTDDTVTSPTSKLKLSSAIYRYEEGGERFQLTITLNGRKFNFDRSITESTPSVLERMKTNISKKLKNADSEELEISFIIGTEEYSVSRDKPFPANVLLMADIRGMPLKLRIGDQEVSIAVNPPEVLSIKFLKQCIVGFPILPIKMEGSPNFKLESSKFLWESRSGDENFPGIKAKGKGRRMSKEIWTARNPGKYVFTPTEADVDSYIRFTCTPSDGTKYGEPLTVEILEPITLPPVQNFLYTERLKTMTFIAEESTNTFRVISYNALCEMLTTPEWFKASPKDSLESEYRLPLINAELRAYQGDILCLQEIEQKHFERYYSPFLLAECGLQGILALKSGEDSYEGVATFYNPNKFRVLESRSINVKEQMKTLPFYASLTDVPGLIERLEDRNTVLQVVVLEHIFSGQRMIVANTHLYFKPDADHIRLLQTITCLKYLDDELQKIKGMTPDKKVMLLFCGDLNCTPPYAAYRLAKCGRIAEDDVVWSSHETEKVTGISFEHKLNLVTAFPAEELTTIVINFEGCIDYIFYQPEHLRLFQRYSPPSKEQIATICNVLEKDLSLPNFQAPSDHLPIIADFSITE